MFEKKFTWVLENSSSWDDETWDGETCYSRRFAVAGCDWRLSAYPSVYSNGDYLSVYLELAPGSSPPGWTRNVQFTFTLVNNLWPKPKSNKVSGGQCCFNANNNIWGFSKFLSLDKLRDRRGGFLVNNRLIIIAEVKILPAIVSPMGPVRITASSLIFKEGNQDSEASAAKSQVAQETENASDENDVDDDDDASEESADDDDTSEDGSDDDDDDDDASEEIADDDDDDASEESADNDDTSEEGSDDDDDDDDDDDASEESADDDDTSEEGSDDDASSSLVSDGENDGAPKEDVDDEVSSLVTNDNATNGSSLDQVKSLEDAMDVNGFEVLASQVESARRIFERHPDIAAEFGAKNQRMRHACMSFLLSLIETLCQSLEELSNEDLVEADIALTYLKDAGFKVDWLEKKLDQLKENKEKEKSGLARLQEIEEDLLKLKKKCSDLDTLAEKEKSELSVTRTALSFDDLV